MRFATAVIVGFLIATSMLAILSYMGFASDPDPDVRLGLIGSYFIAWAYISRWFWKKQSPAWPASWHPDPLKRHELRYWNGSTWTEHVADGEVLTTDPPI
jgi:hypothetical protein